MMRVKLHSEVIPVRGFNRSAIYDLNRKTFYLIPNSLVDFLTEIDGRSYSEFIRQYNKQEKNVFDEYMHFLHEKELVFTTGSKYYNMFSKISLEWDFPGLLQRATIDYSGIYPVNEFYAFLLELDRVGVKVLNIRLLIDNPMAVLGSLVDIVHESGFNQVSFFLSAQSDLDIARLSDIIANDARVKRVWIHNAVEDVIQNSNARCEIIMLSDDFEGQQSIAYNRFIVDMSLFAQAQHCNVFFNRYLYIDGYGQMKNSLRSRQVLGCISESKSIEKVIGNSQYTNLFFARKDDTEICSVCEFRYMCFSNRNVEKIVDGRWRIVEQDECDYNPYISKWKNEENFYPIHKVGFFSEQGNFILDRARINGINRILWKP